MKEINEEHHRKVSTSSLFFSALTGNSVRKGAGKELSLICLRLVKLLSEVLSHLTTCDHNLPKI